MVRCNALMLSTLLLAGLAGADTEDARADDRVEQLQFTAGTSSAKRTDTIRGYDGLDYVLGARSGQTMQILFNPNNTSCYFNVTPSESQTAIFNGSVTGNEFAQELPGTGDYKIHIYLMRNAARRDEICNFEISFEISGDQEEAGEREDQEP